MNYTHVEFMPVMAHPLGLSWGYQLMGYLPSSRLMVAQKSFKTSWKNVTPQQYRRIVDWVPGHFIINDDALAYYDGTPTLSIRMNIGPITMVGGFELRFRKKSSTVILDF